MSDDKSIREKLIHQGVAALTDAELISVVIRDGGDGVTAAQLAQNILAANGGSLHRLSRVGLKELRMTAGLGVKRAAILSAALELGRRLTREETLSPEVIRSKADAEMLFRPLIAALPHEEFWVLYLSSANTIVGKAKVSQGGVSATAVDQKLILKRAVELLASGLILVHNHPSGVAEPSGDDVRLTEKIAESAAFFDISVLDHLIITTGECFSFRQSGMMK